MHITISQAQITKNSVGHRLGAPNKVWLFVSRANDDQVVGDINLLIETEARLPNPLDVLCRLYGALIMALGDRKLDIVLRDARTCDASIFEIARRTGVML